MEALFSVFRVQKLGPRYLFFGFWILVTGLTIRALVLGRKPGIYFYIFHAIRPFSA